MIKGAIFDMDGVLVDNLHFHLDAFQRFGEEQGQKLTRKDIQAVFGQRNEDMLRVLINKNLSKEESDRFADRKEEIYREMIGPTLKDHVVPGLLSFLQDLSEAGIHIALATSGPVKNVDFVLDGIRIRPYFEAIVTGDQVVHGKPHPEAFLLAASKIQTPPTECVVFEDSISGIRAAINGACKCVALTTTHSLAEIQAEAPHRIIADFTGMTRSALAGLK